tara:strand:+ start:334 stop:498 length:165 start_codon:yes stop_codon:yes gene_type:complete
MRNETIFHVYDGDECIFANLSVDEFKKKILNSEIDLTDHEVEMVRGVVDNEASY